METGSHDAPIRSLASRVVLAMTRRRRAINHSGAPPFASASLGSLLLWLEATPARAAGFLEDLAIDPQIVSFAFSGG
ncbi:MAG: hypothetical protein ACXW52_25940, partial [Candidatus Binatia bacterium]